MEYVIRQNIEQYAYVCYVPLTNFNEVPRVQKKIKYVQRLEVSKYLGSAFVKRTSPHAETLLAAGTRYLITSDKGFIEVKSTIGFGFLHI